MQETEGITNLKVEVIEGIATVEVRMKIPILGPVTNSEIYVIQLSTIVVLPLLHCTQVRISLPID